MGSKCKDKVFFDATDASHDGDDTVMDKENIAEKGHNYETLDSNVDTLKYHVNCFEY